MTEFKKKYFKRFLSFSSEGQQFLSHLVKSKAVDEMMLMRGLGNINLRSDYALMLPEILSELHEKFNHLDGLFKPPPKYRGKWATSWISDLSNRGKGVADGIAYEVLAGRRVLLEDSLNLNIQKSDHCSFCSKLQASYPGSELYLKNQPDRNTVESDLQIFVAEKAWEVGIDFKHTSGRRVIRLSKSQLDGLGTALRTGEIDQFWFITNSKFSKNSLKSIHLLNQDLMKNNTLDVDDPLLLELVSKTNGLIEPSDLGMYPRPSEKIKVIERFAV